MRWFVLFLLGSVPIVWGAYHIVTSRAEMVEKVKTFCQATHAGEPWSHVLDRAKEQQLEFVRANAATEKTEEWLTDAESFSDRYGCRVMVSKGMVINTNAGALPPR